MADWQIRGHTVYAFIDSQNLNLGVRNDIYSAEGKKYYSGWKLDFRKFRNYLKDKYKVDKAFLFIGYIAANEEMYAHLVESGYELVYKRTLEYAGDEGEDTVTKGNVDTELVLYAAAKEFENYDKAVIVSGDGDFDVLCEYLIEKGKLLKLVLPNKQRYSSLLRDYSDYFDYVSTQRKKLEYRVRQTKSEHDPEGRTPQGNSLS